MQRFFFTVKWVELETEGFLQRHQGYAAGILNSIKHNFDLTYAKL